MKESLSDLLNIESDSDGQAGTCFDLAQNDSNHEPHENEFDHKGVQFYNLYAMILQNNSSRTDF